MEKTYLFEQTMTHHRFEQIKLSLVQDNKQLGFEFPSNTLFPPRPAMTHSEAWERLSGSKSGAALANEENW